MVCGHVECGHVGCGMVGRWLVWITSGQQWRLTCIIMGKQQERTVAGVLYCIYCLEKCTREGGDAMGGDLLPDTLWPSPRATGKDVKPVFHHASVFLPVTSCRFLPRYHRLPGSPASVSSRSCLHRCSTAKVASVLVSLAAQVEAGVAAQTMSGRHTKTLAIFFAR